MTNWKNVKWEFIDGNIKYDFLTENNSQALYDKVQSDIDELRNTQKVDYVILLTHLGRRCSRRKYKCRLIKKYYGYRCCFRRTYSFNI